MRAILLPFLLAVRAAVPGLALALVLGSILVDAAPPAEVAAPETKPSLLPYQDPSLPVEKRVDDLISRMTLAEKVSQMNNNAASVERLGIPEYNWWNECLHGVAAAGIATVFPQSIGLGATWDPDLIHEVATATSDEARAKHHESLHKGERGIFHGLTFWSPNINIFRDPRWGRGQETYGEDPYLTSRLGVAFVRGLQGDDPRYLKLVSTPKHYAVHSGPEPLRNRFNAVVDDRNLYETYLPHFETCVREAKAFSVMCAYNRVNGEPCCSNRRLLEEILRQSWGFEGYVVSDCGAIDNIYQDHKVVGTAEEAAARALNNGCDLCCGETYSALLQAVQKGLVTEDTINRALRRLFTARFRLGMFDPPELVPYAQIPYSVVDSPLHRRLALRAARESIVLLKNEGNLLPLSRTLGCIAVIGPNANAPDVLLGNYNGTPSYSVTPLGGLLRGAPPGVRVVTAKGCELQGFASAEAIPSARLVPSKAKTGERGLRGEYFNNTDLKGEPVLTRIDTTVDFNWAAGAPAPEMPKDHFSVRWSGTLTPATSGNYVLGTTADDGVRLSLDGKNLIDDWNVHAAQTHTATVTLEAGRAYPIVLEYYESWGEAVARLVWAPPAEQDRLKNEALEAARQADVVVMALGISAVMENEGYDRTGLDLPQAQQELLETIHATGKPIVLVLLSGSALAVTWAEDHVPAILAAWYPGEEGGTAIADVIFGTVNPGGRLPITFYKSLEQVPAFEDYDVAAGRTYKYFTGEPLYPFGYGMSYTTFRYRKIRILPEKPTPGENVTVSVRVKNTGTLDGDEVVQVYLTLEGPRYVDSQAREPLAPIRELQGFRRVHLTPGEEQRVEFVLTPRQFSRVDEQGRHRVEPGRVQVSVGGCQPGTEKRGGARLAAPVTGTFEVIGVAQSVN